MIWSYRPEVPLRTQTSGPLAGLRFSVKDLFGVNSMPMSASTHATLPTVGPSPLVTELLDAGAELVGKTHLHEIALGITGHNPHIGYTPHPQDAQRLSGGSSSGAAVSVASGECDFALATDTGGSIRIPAALCGLVGFKPSYGLYSTEGLLPLSPSCDHAGLIARDLATTLQVHQLLSGQRAKTLSPDTLRLGLWDVESWVTPAVWQAIQTATQKLTLERFSFPDVLPAYTPIVLSEAATVHLQALQSAPQGFGPETLALLQQGSRYLATDYLQAQHQREIWRNHMLELFKHFDFLLAPTVPDVAPHHQQSSLTLPDGEQPLRSAFLRLTAPWSLLGVPVLSLPIKIENMSVGLQLIAHRGHDAKLFGLAQALENL